MILTVNFNDLQDLTNKLVQSSQEFGEEININKTKYMVVSKKTKPQSRLCIDPNG